ncbi:MAG: 16S rRNA (guanine(527)-N(7))-methyltransferase RsmG [Mycobacteriales bacterium]
MTERVTDPVPRDLTGQPATDHDDPGVGTPPEAATAVFGDRLGDAVAYADLLATAGVARGLIGPREVPRLWDRHLLNCAVVAELIPAGSQLIDVGSGAGLPGIPLALARPDLTVVLLEPLARRAAFLTEVVEQLALPGVSVLRVRAEEHHAAPLADIVTARAVAPLDRLVPWTLPLVAPAGRLLALKGRSAQDEIDRSAEVIRRAGGQFPRIRLCGTTALSAPTTVVEIVRGRSRSSRRGSR